ncbi:MAG: hypothetical protein ACOC32_02900 [Nanoarchaeota archaeon]
MNKKGVLAGIFFVLVALMAYLVIWGLFGAFEVDRLDVSCQVSFGVLCFRWPEPQADATMLHVLSDGFYYIDANATSELLDDDQ